MALDGVVREEAQDPDVHRDLIVVDPPMLGRDVGNANRSVHARLRARSLTDDMPSPTHDRWTHAAAVAAAEAGYWLGLRSDTYLATVKVDGERRLMLSQGAQRVLRNPNDRTDDQLARAKVRRGVLDEGPRYYDDLAKTVAPSAGKGPQAALAFLKANLGVHETPAGSNWGGKVQDWIRLAGYTSPVPWCGCATNAALVSAGVANGSPWGIGFCPSVRGHAQRGADGWSWHTEGEPGDIVLFAGPDGIPEHQGLVVRRVGPGHYITREGNTSKGDGSQSDGGIVAERDRVSTSAFRIVGFARPSW